MKLDPHFGMLPERAFLHYGDRRIKPQGGAGIPIVSDIASAAGSVVTGAASALGSAASGALDIVDSAVSTLGNAVGDTVESVGHLLDGAARTVGNILEDPKKLAMVALTVAYPGAAGSIGAALGLEGAAASAVGNAVINTAINGGDIEKGVKTAAALYMGGAAAQEIGELAKASQMDATISNAISKAGGQAVTSAALGQDPALALIAGGANAASDLIANQIPGFSNWDPVAQRTVTSAISAELQGKDVTAVTANALVNGALNAGKSAYKNWEAESEINNILDAQTLPDGYKIVPDLSIPSRPQYNLVTPEGTTYARGSDWQMLVDMANEQSAAHAAMQPVNPADFKAETPLETAPSIAEETTPSDELFRQLAGLPATGPISADTAPMTQQQVDELVGLPQETPVAEAPSAVQEATSSDDFFRSIGIEPSSMTDQAPMSQEEVDALIGTLPQAEKQPTPTTGGIVTNAPSVTTPTSQTATQTAAAPTQTAPAAAQKPQLSSQDILGLLEIAGAFDQPQQAQSEESPYSNIDLSDPRFAEVNYLGALGEAPSYLGEDQISEEDKAMLETIGLSPDEISNILEASGMKGSGAIKPGMGVPEGTFKPAGSRTYDIYRALEKDPAMAAKIRQLPLAGFSDDYTKQFISSAEQALNPAWATYRPGVEVAKSFQPPLSQGDARTAAYVPKYDVNTYTGFNPEKYGASSATTPETIGLVTTNPSYLKDPTAAANMMAHELTHIKQVDPNVLLMEAGGTQQDKQSFAKDLATAMPYLQQKYGYAGGYDTQANAPMSERFADLMGWQFQNNIDFSTDPKFQQMVLNTPERMAAWNASTVPRTTRLDPRDLPPGKIVESDFGLPGAAPKSWLVQQLIRNLLGKQ